MSIHIGRSFTGTALEDTCPCPKAPCGLVIQETADLGCPEHAPTAMKTTRQGHAAENCPALVDEKEQGLLAKYEVRRLQGGDGPGEKHEDCRYFVLDLTHDPIAREAARAYATAAGAAGYFPLRQELHDLLDRIEGRA